MARPVMPVGTLWLAALFAMGSASAQSNVPREETWITDGPVYAIATTPTTTYLGGEFTYIGPQTGSWVPIAADTGLVRPGFPKVDGQVQTCAPDGSGGWYIGGSFRSVGGLPRKNLAHIYADGTVDSTWRPEANYAVNALVPFEGRAFIGGGFWDVDGQRRMGLAALDLATGEVTDWDPDPQGPMTYVCALAVSGGIVYAGGFFDDLGGEARTNIAAVDAYSGAVMDWNPGANGCVEGLVVANDVLYVMGSFNVIGGKARRSVAQFSLATGEVTDWNPELSHEAYALVVSGDTVYLGGGFTQAGGQTCGRIAAVDTVTGATAATLDAFNSSITALALGDGTLYAIGWFDSVGGQHRRHLAAIDLATGHVTSWDPRGDRPADVLAFQGDTVFAGGQLASVGGVERTNVAAVDAITGSATDWCPHPKDVVRALVASEDTVYMGGAFRFYGGLVAFDRLTGTVEKWTPFTWDINNRPDVSVLALSSGILYAGGPFTKINGQLRNHIAALDPVTGVPLAWDPDVDGDVNALAVSEGTVYAGGSFSAVGGQPRNHIAAIDASTGLPTPWNPNADDEVNALSVSGSAVYAGGYFSQIGGQPRHRIAALDRVTGQATAWNPRLESTADDDFVNALALSGTIIYVGGDHLAVGGQTRLSLIASDAVDGSATGWQPQLLYSVFSIVPSERSLYVGGCFYAAHNTYARRFAEYANPGFAFTHLPQGGDFAEGQRLLLHVGFTGTVGPVHIQWRKDGVDIPGADGSTFEILNLQFSDAGDYDAVITDSAKAFYPTPVATVDVHEPWAVPASSVIGLALSALLLAAGIARQSMRYLGMTSGRRRQK